MSPVPCSPLGPSVGRAASAGVHRRRRLATADVQVGVGHADSGPVGESMGNFLRKRKQERSTAPGHGVRAEEEPAQPVGPTRRRGSASRGLLRLDGRGGSGGPWWCDHGGRTAPARDRAGQEADTRAVARAAQVRAAGGGVGRAGPAGTGRGGGAADRGARPRARRHPAAGQPAGRTRRRAAGALAPRLAARRPALADRRIPLPGPRPEDGAGPPSPGPHRGDRVRHRLPRRGAQDRAGGPPRRGRAGGVRGRGGGGRGVRVRRHAGGAGPRGRPRPRTPPGPARARSPPADGGAHRAGRPGRGGGGARVRRGAGRPGRAGHRRAEPGLPAPAQPDLLRRHHRRPRSRARHVGGRLVRRPAGRRSPRRRPRRGRPPRRRRGGAGGDGGW